MKPQSQGNSNQEQAQPEASQLCGPTNLPLAYFNMPKSACTTIKNILYYVQYGHWHPNPLAIHREIKDKNLIIRGSNFLQHRRKNPFGRPFVTFTFVRNPGPRAYSAFVEKIWATGPYAFPKIREILAAKYQYRLGPLENGKYSLEDIRTGFKQFLNFVTDNLDGKTIAAPNPHWMCQYNRLNRQTPKDYVAFIGRVETFAEDMSFVLRKAGWDDVSIASTRFNEGPPPPFKLADVFDDEINSLFMNLYQKDYAAFDYEVLPCSSPSSQGWQEKP
jgi:hypothetical protein